MDIALIWMSVGNSYFSESRIGKLLRFADMHFQKILLISPEKPAEHNFKAAGYSEKEARKKAKHDANLLKHRAERQLASIGTPSKFAFVDWDKIIVDKEYQKRYEEIKALYKNNATFRADARTTTNKVLSTKFANLPDENAINEAVLYLHEELAFVLALPVIYDAEITYIYHQPWDIFEKLINGEYDNKKRKPAFMLTEM